MTYYLVGPSGAGKSRLGKLLASEGVIEFVDSDHAIVEARGEWEAVLVALEIWEAQDELLPRVVAVGAGTQDIDRINESRPLRKWLADRSERVIVIRCTPEETLLRRPQFHSSLDSVRDVEFAPERLQIYEIAHNSVDTSSLTKQEAALHLMRAMDLEVEIQLRSCSAQQETLST